MNKTIQKLKEKMEREYMKSRKTQKILSEKIKKYFDFEVDVTFCEGDGFLIIDVDTSDVFLFDVFKCKKKGIKLKRNDCFYYAL